MKRDVILNTYKKGLLDFEMYFSKPSKVTSLLPPHIMADERMISVTRFVGKIKCLLLNEMLITNSRAAQQRHSEAIWCTAIHAAVLLKTGRTGAVTVHIREVRWI